MKGKNPVILCLERSFLRDREKVATTWEAGYKPYVLKSDDLNCVVSFFYWTKIYSLFRSQFRLSMKIT